MKELDLSIYGVKEITSSNATEINVGRLIIPPLAWFIMGLLAAELLDKEVPSNFEKGRQAARDFWGY
ncbi:MAG: hypothetical protein LBL90_07490 [Prevotellaceae bacterium]|jgi:hypothetical protein|nr:hypothetical protein [Prevotellaceae bacterium]